MPSTSTVFPANPPSVKRDPDRTSVSSARRIGDVALAAGVGAGVEAAVADTAAAAVGEGAALVTAGAAGAAQPTPATAAA